MIESNVKSLSLIINNNEENVRDKYPGYVSSSNSFISKSYISSSKVDMSEYSIIFSPASDKIQYHVFSKPSNSTNGSTKALLIVDIVLIIILCLILIIGVVSFLLKRRNDTLSTVKESLISVN